MLVEILTTSDVISFFFPTFHAYATGATAWTKTFSPTVGGEMKAALALERSNFKTVYQKVQRLGGIPHIIRSVDMSNTIPDEKVGAIFLYFLVRCMSVNSARLC